LNHQVLLARHAPRVRAFNISRSLLGQKGDRPRRPPDAARSLALVLRILSSLQPRGPPTASLTTQAPSRGPLCDRPRPPPPSASCAPLVRVGLTAIRSVRVVAAHSTHRALFLRLGDLDGALLGEPKLEHLSKREGRRRESGAGGRRWQRGANSGVAAMCVCVCVCGRGWRTSVRKSCFPPSSSRPARWASTTPSLKTMTAGSIWIFSFAMKKGAFSALRVRNLHARCFGARICGGGGEGAPRQLGAAGRAHARAARTRGARGW